LIVSLPILPQLGINPILGLVVAGVIGVLSGQLPDRIEPSKNDPQHRRFFHSFVFLGFLLYLNYVAIVNYSFLWSLILTMGYISYLALDATTSDSLPILGLDL
jgi:membrane-bound metal-dependent hydrolase YbcI (DUF457 family)